MVPFHKETFHKKSSFVINNEFSSCDGVDYDEYNGDESVVISRIFATQEHFIDGKASFERVYLSCNHKSSLITRTTLLKVVKEAKRGDILGQFIGLEDKKLNCWQC